MDSGGSSLKYCEQALAGIKRAFKAVLAVPPYLAEAHLLSVSGYYRDDFSDQGSLLPSPCPPRPPSVIDNGGLGCLSHIPWPLIFPLY